MNITFRHLCITECSRIREIDASQYIGRAWREANGIRGLFEINYFEPDFPNGFENHLKALKDTIGGGGIALGAFCDNLLVGFCSVDGHLFGEKYNYILLDQLFISKEFRNEGIGKALFIKSAKEAKSKGADKLYICAGSAEETIAFYFAIGCKEAKEINQALYLLDSRDYQLEYDLSLPRL